MRIHPFASIALAAVATAAAAQPASQPAAASDAGNPIVVTGQKESRKAIQDFVRDLTPTLWEGKVSRFEHEVCPGVYGLAKPQAQAVEDRIRIVGKSVGIDVAGPGCAPNLVVIATSDKKVLLEELWKHRGEYFGDVPRGHVRDMETDPEPAAVWQLRGAPISASGMDLRWDDRTGAWMNNTTDAGSRITQSARPQFDGAVVVVEKKALADLTTTQLGDYAAIRALTGADPGKLSNSGAPTILHVLEVPVGGQAPITMTKWDYSFLKGFYDTRRNVSAARQRSAIGESMEKQIKQPPGY